MSTSYTLIEDEWGTRRVLIEDSEEVARRRELGAVQRRLAREMASSLSKLSETRRKKVLMVAVMRETTDNPQSRRMYAVEVQFWLELADLEIADVLGLPAEEVRRVLDFLHPGRGQQRGKPGGRRRIAMGEKVRKANAAMERATRRLEKFKASNSPAGVK